MLFGVVAHPARRVQAWALTKRLGAVLFMDSETHTLGAYANHMRALEWAARQNEHVAILEDDAEPVETFERKAPAWANRYPDQLMSFYLGSGHPKQWMRRVDHAWDDGNDHITLPTLIHAVTVCYPPGAARIILDHIKPSTRVDFAIGNAWNSTTGRGVVYPKASLVQHADTDQIDNPTLKRAPRKARQLA